MRKILIGILFMTINLNANAYEPKEAASVLIELGAKPIVGSPEDNGN